MFIYMMLDGCRETSFIYFIHSNSSPKKCTISDDKKIVLYFTPHHHHKPTNSTAATEHIYITKPREISVFFRFSQKKNKNHTKARAAHAKWNLTTLRIFNHHPRSIIVHVEDFGSVVVMNVMRKTKRGLSFSLR